MKFFLASMVWVLWALAIGIGIVLAVKGSVWLLIISVLAFIIAVAKIGCATH